MDESKGINTDVNNICSNHTLSLRYQGLAIVVSNSAMRELCKEGKTLYFIIKILECGHDSPRKRKDGRIERWLTVKGKVYCAVIARDYNEIAKEECYVLIHFGKFSR